MFCDEQKCFAAILLRDPYLAAEQSGRLQKVGQKVQKAEKGQRRDRQLVPSSSSLPQNRI